jgi:hypothetical protein
MAVPVPPIQGSGVSTRTRQHQHRQDQFQRTHRRPSGVIHSSATSATSRSIRLKTIFLEPSSVSDRGLGCSNGVCTSPPARFDECNGPGNTFQRAGSRHLVQQRGRTRAVALPVAGDELGGTQSVIASSPAALAIWLLAEVPANTSNFSQFQPIFSSAACKRGRRRWFCLTVVIAVGDKIHDLDRRGLPASVPTISRTSAANGPDPMRHSY